MGARYQEISDSIYKLIEDGTYELGQKLPSETELASRFQVTRQTIRHALAVLDEQGILRKRQGSGTYVEGIRSQRDERRTSIAFIITYVDGYIFPKIIQGIEKKLSEQGYSVQIAFTNNKFEREREILEDFLGREEIAGVIAEPTKSSLPNLNMSLYEAFGKAHVPVLFINSYYEELQLPHISIQDEMAGYKAADYLIYQGHKKIGGIFKLDDGQGRLRYRGFTRALREHNLPFDDSQILWLDTQDIKNFHDSFEKMKKRFQKITGIVCYNDEVAFSLEEELIRDGFKVPEDMSLVSVDNSELATMCEVSLTSINHPKEVLGTKAAEQMMKLIEDNRYDATYEFVPELIVRDSVRRIDTK